MSHSGDRRRDEHALLRAKAMDVSRIARVRLQCVLYAQANGVREAAAHFGFHRSTVAKWAKQYVPGHPETLEEKSRAPHTVRQPETDPKVIEEIQKLRTKDPAINRTEIHEELCRMFQEENVPSESTIGRVLKRLGLTSRDVRPSSEGTPSHGPWIGGLATALLLGIALSLGFSAGTVSAASIGPQTHVYNGRLLNGSGNPVTAAQKIRFSYWLSENFVSGDVTGTGAINTAASTYGDWYEVHAVTPDSNGYFSVQLGSGTALPSLASYGVGDLADLFIQVEVKPSAAADTSYELLDADFSNDAVDRSPVLAVPFALNADFIDQRDVGTGSGAIPLLQSGGLLPVATIPGGTNRDIVIIDNDNTASTEITLQFGQTLAKKLTYDIVNARFNFNASVRVAGDLTVTGLINGIDISGLGTETGTYLRASSGGGLNLRVSQGSYRIDGNVTNFAGSGGVSLRANATQTVFFTGTGLTVTPGTFPADKSFIPVAQVTTSTGSITSITDRRILSSDDRQQTIERNYLPGYEHASFQGDASANVGQLSVTHDSINNHNFYLWTSTKSTLQDYDVFVRVALSADFERWGDTPLLIGYRSTSASNANNALAIAVYDTNGQPVTLGGTSSGLASTSWATTSLTFSGGTWTPGQEFLIKFTMQAKDSFQIHLGKMRLKYVDFLDE